MNLDTQRAFSPSLELQYDIRVAVRLYFNGNRQAVASNIRADVGNGRFDGVWQVVRQMRN